MPAVNTPDDEWEPDPTYIFITATYYKGDDIEDRNSDWSNESDYWNQFLSQVPENLLDRAAWVASRKLELNLQEPYKFIASEEGIDEPRNNNALIPDLRSCKATYVIDLDNEVFAVDGTFHYNLQTFPKNMQQPGRARLHYKAPPDHIGTVSRWKIPTPDFSNTSTEYKSINAVETPIEDWGIRKQNELCASQVLSLRLVNTLLTNEAEVFSNPDVAGQRSLYNMYCWNLVTTTAPGLLDLSTLEESREPRSLRNSEQSYKPNGHSIQSGYFQPKIGCSGAMKGTLCMATDVDTDWDGLYWKLRGCLITFCPRLDTELYEELRIVQMVKKLRSSPSKKTLGTIYSGTQIVAVALEGNCVRRTPVLPVYDIKAITNMEHQTKDGILPLLHLLSPLSANKTNGQLKHLYSLTSISHSKFLSLPNEILGLIIDPTDSETHKELAFVCHTTRTICFQRQRINNDYVLLRAKRELYTIQCPSIGEIYSMELRRENERYCLSSRFMPSYVRRSTVGKTLAPGSDLDTYFSKSY